MPIYAFSCECGRDLEAVRSISECGKTLKCVCGKEAKQIIAPAGYAPWQPFYCATQGRQFDTRESYQKYCRSKGLEGITAREYRDISQEAAHLAKVEKEQRRQAKLEAQG